MIRLDIPAKKRKSLRLGFNIQDLSHDSCHAKDIFVTSKKKSYIIIILWSEFGESMRGKV